MCVCVCSAGEKPQEMWRDRRKEDNILDMNEHWGYWRGQEAGGEVAARRKCVPHSMRHHVSRLNESIFSYECSMMPGTSNFGSIAWLPYRYILRQTCSLVGVVLYCRINRYNVARARLFVEGPFLSHCLSLTLQRLGPPRRS